jgi:hypothetical protein
LGKAACLYSLTNQNKNSGHSLKYIVSNYPHLVTLPEHRSHRLHNSAKKVERHSPHIQKLQKLALVQTGFLEQSTISLK